MDARLLKIAHANNTKTLSTGMFALEDSFSLPSCCRRRRSVKKTLAAGVIHFMVPKE
jgi:hypothetical protein